MQTNSRSWTNEGPVELPCAMVALVTMGGFAGHLLRYCRPTPFALVDDYGFLDFHGGRFTVTIDEGFQVLDRKKSPPPDLRHARAAPFVNQIAQGRT